jgi:hypothetical protein
MAGAEAAVGGVDEGGDPGFGEGFGDRVFAGRRFSNSWTSNWKP